jgi:uncharacterized protein
VGGIGRVYGAGRAILRTAGLLVFILWLGTTAAFAQEPVPRQTIVIFGDSQAQGLSGGLSRVLLEDSRFRVINRTHPGAALVHGESEWLAPVQRFVAREKADIAVVMFGANDRLDLRDERGAYLRFHTDAWRDAYAARIGKILSALTDARLKVIWCGNPIARSPTYSADMGYINTIYEEETRPFGAQFVSLWNAVADGDGRYAAYGKDRGGVTQRMRADDGIHFTAAGYEVIAEKIIGMLATSAVNLR